MIVVHWKGSITVHLLITCQSFFLQLGEFRFQCIQESPTSVHCCMFPQFPQAPFETTVSFGDDYIEPLLFSLALLSAEHRRLFSPRALRLGNEAYDFILDKVKCRARTNNIFRQPHPRVLGRHLRQQGKWLNSCDAKEGSTVPWSFTIATTIAGWIITSSPCSPHLSWHFRKDLWVTSTWSPTSLATVMILTKTHGWKMEEKYQQPVFQMCKDTSWWDGSPWRQVHETC